MKLPKFILVFTYLSALLMFPLVTHTLPRMIDNFRKGDILDFSYFIVLTLFYPLVVYTALFVHHANSQHRSEFFARIFFYPSAAAIITSAIGTVVLPLVPASGGIGLGIVLYAIIFLIFSITFCTFLLWGVFRCHSKKPLQPRSFIVSATIVNTIIFYTVYYVLFG